MESSPPDPPACPVTLGQPRTVGPALQAHVVYTLTFTTHERTYERTCRYRELAELRTLLVERHRDLVVPPIPAKVARGRFDEAFVQHRAGLLQTFVQRLHAHAVLGADACLLAFLRGEAPGNRPPASAPVAVAVRSGLFADRCRALAQQQHCLGAAIAGLQSCVGARRQAAYFLDHVGVASLALGASTATFLVAFGRACGDASTAMQQQSNDETTLLGDALRDVLLYNQASQAAADACPAGEAADALAADIDRVRAHQREMTALALAAHAKAQRDWHVRLRDVWRSVRVQLG